MSAPDLSPAALMALASEARRHHAGCGCRVLEPAAQVLEAIAARDSARAPSLHPLALAVLEQLAKVHARDVYGHLTGDGGYDDDAEAEAVGRAMSLTDEAWAKADCPIWQTPPASPSTVTAAARNLIAALERACAYGEPLPPGTGGQYLALRAILAGDVSTS
jgi:hypothetical protein